MKIKLAKSELIHFVGIGGIGMSGLALIMKDLGFKVQGSDISNNKNIERLKKKKIKIFIGHKKRNINKSTILVISSAIKSNNPELKFAKKRKIPIYKRGEMLANVVSLMKNVVVAGSHGKTTTTSLISNIFSCAKIDPTVINGGVLNSFRGSAKLGKSDWCILESDESDGSFIKIPFTYSIITNIDKEHLDHYKSLEVLKKNFVNFIEKTPTFGKAFICLDDKNNRQVIKKIRNLNYNTYGTSKLSNFKILNISQKENYSKFNLKISLPGTKENFIKNIKTPLIGLHNIRNSTAAAAVAFSVGIPIKIIKKGLEKFSGVQRRFTKVFSFQNVSFFDDYAHHPTEIIEVLDGVRKVYKNKEIMADLVTTLTESVTLNGAIRGTTNTVTTTGINNVYERIVTCTTSQVTVLAAFDSNSYGSEAQIDKEDVRYIRVTNLDTTNTVELAVVGAGTLYQVLLNAGESHILCAASSVMLAEADTTPSFGTMTALQSLRVFPSANLDVEIFVASV